MKLTVPAILVALLAGCASVARAPVATSARYRADLRPQQALEVVRADAVARGFRIADMGLDSLVIDFGTARAQVPVADDASGARTTLSDTEVHCTALYLFAPAPGGSMVTVFDQPTYWHPAERVWLPGPPGVSPGRDGLLRFLVSDAR